jgi:hypothetical protein
MVGGGERQITGLTVTVAHTCLQTHTHTNTHTHLDAQGAGG